MAGEQRRRRLRALLERAGIKDAPLERIEAAFVHDSAAAEQGTRSNERLEFLGDAVLGAVVAHWLYEHFPHDPEGTLAKRKAAIVSDRALAQTAARLGFGELIELGTGERARGGTQRASILGDAFEAFLAALFLGHGLGAVQRFVLREHVASLDLERASQADAKTQLQELTQGRLACAPEYRESGDGPDHARTFITQVQVGGEVLGTGTGPSKKAAQQQAAAAALHALQERFERNDATQEN
ncbi:MAG: ribonuclease III [Candidatus Baltobacteraceae bacterium]